MISQFGLWVVGVQSPTSPRGRRLSIVASMEIPERIELARLPTPLQPLDRLTEAWGGPRLWVKRDDLTGFGLSGNKVRKLEYHLAAAGRRGATDVLTCGALQSNHCRATAVAAARLGMRCHLLLRTQTGAAPQSPTGNFAIAVVTGASVDFVDPDGYRRRDDIMEQSASRLKSSGSTPWVIPEGASDGLGMWGYVEAAREAEVQLEAVGVHSAVHWHAASSGGTTAGLAAHSVRSGIEAEVVGISVSDPADGLAGRVEDVLGQAFGSDAPALAEVNLRIIDRYLGPGYGKSTPEALALQAEVTASTGMLFDPTYTGKALHALHQEITNYRLDPDIDVVFWHTGGGFATFA